MKIELNPQEITLLLKTLEQYQPDAESPPHAKLTNEKIVSLIARLKGSGRQYIRPLEEWDDDIYTVAQWEEAVAEGSFVDYDGSGYWVKDGMKSNDEVFSTKPLDATHVVWYNK